MPPSSIRIPDEVATALDRAAKKNRMSKSDMATTILKEWLVAHGFHELPPKIDLQVKFVNATDGAVTDGPRFKVDVDK